MSERKTRIAIPKGGLLEGSLDSLAKLGLEIPDLKSKENERKLIVPVNDEYELLIVRGHDVPIYVEHGAADLGIAGVDVILESNADIVQLKDLEFGACKLCVCGKKGEFKSISELPSHTRVATTFPHLSKEFFQKHGISHEIIHLYGSVELGPLTELSDVIVDLVATGETLKKNNLEVIDTIMNCTARLFANKVSYRLRNPLIDKLINS